MERKSRISGLPEINDFDKRTPFQHDYDRVIFSSGFRRLAEVTQIVNPSEGILFHNRLTHTIKVSTIGIRLANYIRGEFGPSISCLNHIDPDVVATAALVHDIGNPPFGHAGEEELNELASKKLEDGFEGNAQTFRIVTRLACHSDKENFQGLDLSAATLNAILKYPWLREKTGYHHKKFGVYLTEKKVFDWARTLYPNLGSKRCIEASIMDLADDITNATQDFSDLTRANLLPISQYVSFFRLYENKNGIVSVDADKLRMLEKNPLCNNLINILEKVSEEWAPSWSIDRKNIITKVVEFFRDHKNSTFNIYSNYQGSSFDKISLKVAESKLLQNFIKGIKVVQNSPNDYLQLQLEQESCDEIIIFKAIIRNFIETSPALQKQQIGEKRIIRDLFNFYNDIINKDKYAQILPTRAREEVDKYKKNPKPKNYMYRIILDTISGMTDQEAITTYNRLFGVNPGSIFDQNIA